MQTVCLKPLFHRGKENIALYYPNDKVINLAVRKLKDVRWSQTNKCWYVPLTDTARRMIEESLKIIAVVDSASLTHYLEKKKQVAKTVATTSASPANSKTINNLAATPAWKLSRENLEALQKLVEQLKLKAYSASTIRTYRNEFLQLLQVLKTKPVYDLTTDEIKRYMVYIMERQGISENTAHSRLNALKFYFEQVLGREKFFWEIPRPKKPLQLPNVLGGREITGLFKALGNLKHKAILFTAYSAGLRVSEVVNLRLEDIDSDRMQIKIKSGKGKKDRYVGLSPIVLDILRSYIKTSRLRPVKFLFESEIPGKAYSSRSAQKVFQRAKEKAGIRKEVSFHSLRHSFATHLLEKGIDIRFIKDILGHFSIKTTERYLHLKKEQLIQIVSPLDDLWLKGELS